MDIKIESGIAMPSRAAPDCQRYMDALNAMLVGDSFPYRVAHIGQMSRAIAMVSRANGAEYATRKTGGERRVWRVK